MQNHSSYPIRQYTDNNKQGTPLVLVHGFLGGKAMWQPVLPLLSTDRRVIAADLPGFGADYQHPSPSSITDFAAIVWSFLDQLEVSHCDLLGHSMGGMIVQEMMHLQPERIKRFICYGTGALGALPDRFETLAASRERFARDGVGITANRIAETWFREGKEAEHFNLCQKLGEKVQLKNAQAGLHAMEGWDGREYLNAITQPTLVIAGDNDRSYGKHYINMLAEKISNAEKKILCDCCHNAHLEQPEKFANAVDNFLKAS